MKVLQENTPETKGIKSALKKVDFTDTFSIRNHKDNIETIAHLIFGAMPKWVSFLMKLRNVLVKSFGLKTGSSKDHNTNLKPGDNMGFIQTFSVTNNEIILGADDKHLNFRVSVYNSLEPKNNIKVTTLVEYNNLFGKIYMSIIRPFHVLIVKHMVKQAYKA